MVGPRGAATVFGPQKGATPAHVARLEAGLRHWCSLLHAASGVDPAGVPHGGAAGGLPGGMHAALGARLVSGFDEIATRLRLRERMAGCGLCLTGEGRIDEQSLHGKVVGGVARLARQVGVPAIAFAGAARPPGDEGVRRLAALLDLHEIIIVTPPGDAEESALRDAAANLRAAATRFARSISA
jgi:glycerate kinase